MQDFDNDSDSFTFSAFAICSNIFGWMSAKNNSLQDKINVIRHAMDIHCHRK